MHQYSSKGRKPSLVPDVHVGSYDATVEDRVDKSLLTEVERQQLAAWNATQQEYSQDLCIPQLVERQARATPEAPALFMGDQFLSYKQLNDQANRLAHHLQACGVRSNVLVGICIERSLDMVVGLLAILKAGGAYVPLDPSYPAERLTLMLRDAQVPVLVTKRQTAACLSVRHASIVCIDDAEALARMSTDDPAPIARADDIAYVVYTSGSTGRPKGVQITHRSLLNLVFWHQRTFEVKASDRATQFASPSFDVAGEELWSHLTIGASVYLIDEAMRFDSIAIRDWLVNHGITVAILPTALVESLMSLAWPPTTALRVMLTGGDALYRYPPPTLPFAVTNNYGPTEATVVATYGRVFPLLSPGLNSVEANLGDARRECQDGHATAPPSIGRPIANAQIYILDEHLQQVPIGVPGELHIGGAGLAMGYLNRPELTAERFIPHPFCKEPGARLYKTGDLARFLPDGQIAFMGRTDYQIKIRGYRIEPNEIMHILSRHPAIETSMVVAREDTPGEKRLVAYIGLVPGEHVTIGSLRDALLQHLPQYMVPSVFVVLDDFPINSTGKVDRSALPIPTTTNTLRDEEIITPGTPTEKRLVEIVACLLQLEAIGIDDDFFALGMHSLLATQLITKVSATFGIDLPLPTVFEVATIRQLAIAIEQLIVAKLAMMTEDEVMRLLMA